MDVQSNLLILGASSVQASSAVHGPGGAGAHQEEVDEELWAKPAPTQFQCKDQAFQAR